MVDAILSSVLEDVNIQHDCGDSPACPAWQCTMRREKFMIQELSMEIERMVVEENCLEERMNTSGMEDLSDDLVEKLAGLDIQPPAKKKFLPIIGRRI